MPERPTLEEYLAAAEREDRRNKRQKVAKVGGVVAAGFLAAGVGAREMLREDPRPQFGDAPPPKVQRVDVAELAREREAARPTGFVLAEQLPVSQGTESGDASVVSLSPTSEDVVSSNDGVVHDDRSPSGAEQAGGRDYSAGSLSEHGETKLIEEVDQFINRNLRGKCEEAFQVILTRTEEEIGSRLLQGDFLPFRVCDDHGVPKLDSSASEMIAFFGKVEGNHAAEQRLRNAVQQYYRRGMEIFARLMVLYPEEADDTIHEGIYFYVVRAQRTFEKWFRRFLPENLRPSMDTE